MNAPHHKPSLEDRFLTRRDFLCRCGMGFGMVSLATLLAPEILCPALAAESGLATSPLALKPPHFPGKAKRVIHIFDNGGPSHGDTVDPKPILARFNGQQLPIRNLPY